MHDVRHKLRRAKAWLSRTTLVTALFLWLSSVLVAFRPLPVSAFAMIGALATVSILTADTSRIRGYGVIIVCFSVISASLSVHREVKLERSQKDFVTYVTSLRAMRNKMTTYCEQHPGTALTNLAGYMQAGALSVADTAFLHGAEVRVFPYLSNGTEADTFLEIRDGHMRTTVSQVGGVFRYDTNGIVLIGGSDRPSALFQRTVNQDFRGMLTNQKSDVNHR